ncbi:protein lin-10-like isoform X4 [Macrosteles quadrilineatus]|uniref:protein lin-10-like isoform X4 n=1 Tax=Macrosteles quadrilineatus TaxID=74068 RepID=UPI0023E11996|nr:protein lin-10-like isoform X4 [Macrosteles quadrilineatus]
MTSVSLKLDNLGSSEQITKLFPKCRPRDINLNPTITLDNHDSLMMDPDRSECGVEGEGAGEGEESCSQDTSPEESNEEEDDDMTSGPVTASGLNTTENNKVVLQLTGSANKPATYKLRDSRIIEIAGGREVFCQSRTKALRKSRSEDKMAANRCKSRSPAHPGGVWELRTRTGEPKRSPSSREVTETVFSTEVRSVRHQRPQSLKGGAVVFDDIDDNWKSLRLPTLGSDQRAMSSGGSTPSPPGYHSQHPPAHFFKVSNSVSDGESLSPERERDSGGGGGKVPRVIGGLPIAEYEGSPRRYGPRQSENPVLPSAHSLLASPSVYLPRPGFPQRVVSGSGEEGENPGALNSEGGPPQTPTPPHAAPNPHNTFDYLYEFSETRKVLEEFFKPGDNNNKQDLDYELRRQSGSGEGNAYVGLRLAKSTTSQEDVNCETVHKAGDDANVSDLMAMQSSCGGSTEDLETEVGQTVGHSRNFTLSPETTDCDSNCDSEASSLLATEPPPPAPRTPLLYSSMPVLEDGLSSGHTSDTDNNNPTVLLMKRQITEIEREIVERSSRREVVNVNGKMNGAEEKTDVKKSTTIIDPADIDLECLDPLSERTPPPPAPQPHRRLSADPPSVEAALKDIRMTLQRTKTLPHTSPTQPDKSPIWIPRKKGTSATSEHSGDEVTLPVADEPDTDLETDRLLGQQRTDDHGFYDDKENYNSFRAKKGKNAHGWRKVKTRAATTGSSGGGKLPPSPHPSPSQSVSSVANESEAPPTTSPALPSPPLTSPPPISTSPTTETTTNGNSKSKKEKDGVKKKGRNKEGMIHEPTVLIEGVLFRARYLGSTQLVCEGQPTKSTRMMQAEEAVSRIKVGTHHAGCELAALNPSDSDSTELSDLEADLSSNARLGPGSLFRLRFLGSVAVDEEERSTCKRRLKKTMVEEAVMKIKAPEGETQPSTEVDLFISTEKIMVLNTDLKEIMMDHALRTISYIADIGDLVVLMARRRFVPHEVEDPPKINRTPKMICHVFESEEAQFIAQSIGQAFQVAYMEFLKANGIEDHSFVKEMDYQEVLNSQEIFGDELQMFAKKEMQKEVVVPKAKGEILGVVIVESGWGSMLPTVVIANLAPAGAAARCGQLNIGDQIIAINGVSLVGLPLSTCQNYIKNSKTQTVVKLTVVPCAPVVEVKIKRPDTKYQLGFSVQNGVICSLLRGGIAERGGVRVGHRIIEINNQSVVAVPHEKIVNLLATSVGEILMKTMPTSMFRLLTGQETPVYI